MSWTAELQNKMLTYQCLMRQTSWCRRAQLQREGRTLYNMDTFCWSKL